VEAGEATPPGDHADLRSSGLDGPGYGVKSTVHPSMNIRLTLTPSAPVYAVIVTS